MFPLCPFLRDPGICSSSQIRDSPACWVPFCSRQFIHAYPNLAAAWMKSSHFLVLTLPFCSSMLRRTASPLLFLTFCLPVPHIAAQIAWQAAEMGATGCCPFFLPCSLEGQHSKPGTEKGDFSLSLPSQTNLSFLFCAREKGIPLFSLCEFIYLSLLMKPLLPFKGIWLQ